MLPGSPTSTRQPSEKHMGSPGKSLEIQDLLFPARLNQRGILVACLPIQLPIHYIRCLLNAEHSSWRKLHIYFCDSVLFLRALKSCRLRDYTFNITLNVHRSYWQIILGTKSLNVFLSPTESPSFYLEHYSLRSILLKEKCIGFFRIPKPLGRCVSWINQQSFECFPSFTYPTIINL